MANQNQQRNDSIHAAGSIAATTGTVVSPVSGALRDWTCSAAVASVYTITLGSQIDATERCILASPRGILDSLAVPNLAAETDSSFTVSTGVASTGAAGDRAFDFVVLRVA